MRPSRTLSASLVFILPVCLGVGAGCSTSSVDDDADTSQDELREIFGQSDFEIAPTLHPGEDILDYLEKSKGVIAHPIYIGADEAHPVTLDIHAYGAGDFKKGPPCPDNCGEVAQLEVPVQMAILSPPKANGRRKTLDSQASKFGNVHLKPVFTKPGQYLIVIGSLGNKRGRIQLQTNIKKGNDWAGAVVSPLAGALTGRALSIKLNPALPASTRVELWANPPPQGSPKRLIAEGTSVEHVATFPIAPDQAIDGDDLTIVVPATDPARGEPPYESGSRIRLWETDQPGVRLDRLGLSIDATNIKFSFSGVAGFAEWTEYYGSNTPDGFQVFYLRSMDRRENGKPLFVGYGATDFVSSTLPGQSGSMGMFDATISVAQGKKLTPTTGEILSVSAVAFAEDDDSWERPSYTVLGCFKFDPYAPQPVACP